MTLLTATPKCRYALLLELTCLLTADVRYLALYKELAGLRLTLEGVELTLTNLSELLAGNQAVPELHQFREHAMEIHVY